MDVALGGENAHSDTPASKCEMLIQQLEDFKLAKQKLIGAETTSHRLEKYDHNKAEPTTARAASNHDLTRCWHKFTRKTTDSEELQNQSPCFCQRIGQWSPFHGSQQHGLYTWAKRWPDTPRPSGVAPSEIHCRPPRVSTPVRSGDCWEHVVPSEIHFRPPRVSMPVRSGDCRKHVVPSEIHCRPPRVSTPVRSGDCWEHVVPSEIHCRPPRVSTPVRRGDCWKHVVPSEIHFRPPIVSTPDRSGDCRKHVAMRSWMERSLDDSSDMSRSFEEEIDVRTSPEHQKLIAAVTHSQQSHDQASSLGDTLPSAASPRSHSAVLETMYVLSEDETDSNSFSPVCSCHRPPKLILCKSCGKTLTGRVRKRCHLHPKQVYLMDVLCCSQCESQDLKEV